MQDAINFVSGFSKQLYTGLRSCNAPVLGVSFMTVIFALLFIKVLIWVIGTLTHTNENTAVSGGRIDNNNNYIYRR